MFGLILYVGVGFVSVFLKNPLSADFVKCYKKLQSQNKNRSNLAIQAVNVGAAGRIRTADLILTKDALYLLSYSSILATKKGLEPSTSSVTGWRSNQLNYLALSRSRELKLAYYSKCGGKCQHPFPDFLAKISVPGGRQICRPAFLTAPALRTTSRTAPSCR